ncbi:MAG TPA: hypothetical protein VHW90_11975 [Stellaceae bacterium]|jgi:hypothetical protein|nr:hypothetical protein [Stellaceae bacterium]
MRAGHSFRVLLAGLAGALSCLCVAGTGWAGGPTYQIGDRQFPATPTTDDPFIADAVYGTAQWLRQNGSPNFGELGLGFAAEKRLTPDLGIEFEGSYDIETPLNQPNAYGFTNFAATVKYQLLKSEAHESLLSVGVEREFGGTGAYRVGGEAVGSTTPTIYFGKGLGDLPDDLKYLRPIAVTGTLGYQIADQHVHDGDGYPSMIQAGISLQYSLRYLQGNVEYVGLPPVIGRLTPIVEIAYSAPAGRAYGQAPSVLLAPGIIYSQDGVDYAIEAQLPLSQAAGTGIGVIAFVHVPLGNFSALLAKPLFSD